MHDDAKCEVLVVAYGREVAMLREFGDEQAVSSEERFQQIYILEENILHLISKLYVSVILSLDVFRLL